MKVDRILTVLTVMPVIMLLTCCAKSTYYSEEMNLMYGAPSAGDRGVFYVKKKTDERILKMAIEDTRRYGNCFFLTWTHFVESKDRYLHSLNSYMWSYDTGQKENYIVAKYIFSGEVAWSERYACEDVSWVGTYNSFLNSKIGLFVYSAPVYENQELHFMQKKDGKVVDYMLYDFEGPIQTPGAFEFMDNLTRDVIKYKLIPLSLIELPDSVIHSYYEAFCK